MNRYFYWFVVRHTVIIRLGLLLLLLLFKNALLFYYTSTQYCSYTHIQSLATIHTHKLPLIGGRRTKVGNKSRNNKYQLALATQNSKNAHTHTHMHYATHSRSNSNSSGEDKQSSEFACIRTHLRRMFTRHCYGVSLLAECCCFYCIYIQLSRR